MRAVLLLVAVSLACWALTPAERLKISHLEAIHAQRVEWMKVRANVPLPGVYRDFRSARFEKAENLPSLLKAARDADVQVILLPPPVAAGLHEGILVMGSQDAAVPQFPAEPDSPAPSNKDLKAIEQKFKQFPDEVFAIAGDSVKGNVPRAVELRNASTHILAHELNEASILASLAGQHTYAAHDWLCDPAGFYFAGENNLGVYDMGDTIPLLGGTNFIAHFPIPARSRLLRNGAVVAESAGTDLSFRAKDQGEYRLEAWLTVDGEEYPWLYTSPIHAGPPPSLALPTGQMSAGVEVHKDIAYVDDGLAKHKLDLYLPKGTNHFRVMVFLHGGSWRFGDRSMYPLFGDRFAKAGIGVVVPSYRLMPQNPHPSQIDDAAAAFAWVYKNIAQYGGDPARIYLAGHSSGGHLASLLALNPAYLAKYEVPAPAIRGVISMSGVYDVSMLDAFKNAADDPSPLHHLRGHAPPFLITYCEWDYLGLPRQAREIAAALKARFVETQLLYISGESHISEIIDTLKENDPTASAILNFVK